jgi:hypothetical protein
VSVSNRYDWASYPLLKFARLRLAGAERGSARKTGRFRRLTTGLLLLALLREECVTLATGSGANKMYIRPLLFVVSGMLGMGNSVAA